jgi:hypothetical protein
MKFVRTAKAVAVGIGEAVAVAIFAFSSRGIVGLNWVSLPSAPRAPRRASSWEEACARTATRAAELRRNERSQ